MENNYQQAFIGPWDTNSINSTTQISLPSIYKQSVRKRLKTEIDEPGFATIQKYSNNYKINPRITSRKYFKHEKTVKPIQIQHCRTLEKQQQTFCRQSTGYPNTNTLSRSRINQSLNYAIKCFRQSIFNESNMQMQNKKKIKRQLVWHKKSSGEIYSHELKKNTTSERSAQYFNLTKFLGFSSSKSSRMNKVNYKKVFVKY